MLKSIYLGFRRVKVQRVTVVEFGMYNRGECSAVDNHDHTSVLTSDVNNDCDADNVNISVTTSTSTSNMAVNMVAGSSR